MNRLRVCDCHSTLTGVSTALVSLCIALILSFPMCRAEQRDSYWPFSKTPQTLADMVMRPDNLDASFIVNNRVVEYKPLEPEYAELRAEPDEFGGIRHENLESLLKVALGIARKNSHEQPKAFIDALENVGAFYFRQQDYIQSSQLLQEALVLRLEDVQGHESETAAACERLALVHRAVGKFEKAETLYNRSLRLKNNLHDCPSKDLAASHLSMSYLHSEVGNTSRAQNSSLKSYAILGDTKQVEQRPLPTSINGARFGATSKLLVWAKAVIEQERIDDNRRRATALALAQAQRPKPLPGIANIEGVMQPTVSGDVVSRTLSLKIEKKRQKNGIEEQEKNLSDVEIALCTPEASRHVKDEIRNYAKEHAYAIGGFQNTWPPLRERALELLRRLGGVVNRDLAQPLVRTNGAGEFVVDKIPKGEYFIYAQLLTADEAMFWLIPVSITQKDSVRLDLTSENVFGNQLVWSKGLLPRISKPESLSKL